MASVYADTAIDLYAINLHGLLGGTVQFLDNVGFISYLGNTYQDAYCLQTQSHPAQRSYLLGTGITVDPNSALIGGTLQAFQQDSQNGSTWTTSWGIEGISIGAVAAWNVIQSPGSGDDLALIESLLSGADLIRLSPGNDYMRGFAGSDSLVGGAGNDTLFGDDGNDTIEGGAGQDRLYGNAGANRLIGGTGSDTYYVGGSGDTVIETSTLLSELDTVRSTGDFTLSSNVEVLILDGSAIRGTGSAQNNTIVGNGENNVLSGGAGNDWLRGSLGNDSLYGGSGNDQMLGGAGLDRMVGGTGNDSYEVDDARDTVVETSVLITEIDKVSASVSYTLTSNVEQLEVAGTASINGTGNALANRIVGNTAANTLSGLDGNDQLLGNPGNDTLYGGSGSDTLDGGLGSDSMAGGSGNDRYQVDEAGDQVIETGSSTTEVDTVWSSVSFTLGSNVENLLLQGDDPVTGTGNALANSIIGNGAANRIDGRGGADTMLGGAGNDTYVVDHAGDTACEATTVNGTVDAGGIDTVRSSISFTLGSFVEKLVLTGSVAINGTGNAWANELTGNAAANILSGGDGGDTMRGGAGNDVYIVDDIADKVYETTSITSTTDAGGTDKVTSSISFNLAAYAGVSFVENLTLTGRAAINGTGNALANTLVGNSAANALKAAGGNDVLVGGGGADTLDGGAHDDLLRGGAGNDILYGGSGNDCFRFDTALSGSSVENVDQIRDFNPAQDTIQLESSIFTTFGTSHTGAIDPDFFRANTTGLAEDDNDYIIYEIDTGSLFYDSNGSAPDGSVLIALLQPNLALTSADYMLV